MAWMKMVIEWLMGEQFILNLGNFKSAFNIVIKVASQYPQRISCVKEMRIMTQVTPHGGVNPSLRIPLVAMKNQTPTIDSIIDQPLTNRRPTTSPKAILQSSRNAWSGLITPHGHMKA